MKIVVLTYSNLLLLKKCIESIKKYSPDEELIVMDNGATSEIKEYLKQNTEIIVWTNEKNLPVTLAYNEIFKKINEDFVLMNDDVKVCEGWLNKIKEKDAGIVGVYSDNDNQPWQNKKFGKWEGEFLSFFCVFFKKETIQKLGLLDENLAWWGSDNDYCYRAKRAGIKIDIADITIHHEHQGTIKNLENKDEIREKELIYLQEKWRSKSIYLAIPNEGTIRVELATYLMQLLHSSNHKIKVTFPIDKPIDHSRNKIVQDFLATDYEYLLMIDDDIVPKDNILQLLDFDKDIISPVCVSAQNFKAYPLVMKKVSDGVKVDEDKVNKGLVEVDACGTGCILIKRKVLEKIKAPFNRKWDENGLAQLGLDFNFCERAKETGFRVWVHNQFACSHYVDGFDLLSLVLQ